MPALDPQLQELGAARMEEMLQAAGSRIQRAFTTVIAQLRGEVDLNALADLLQEGRLDEALATLEDAAQALNAAVNREFIAAAEIAATFLSNAGVGRVVFDQVNYRAVQIMQENQLRLVSNFNEEQRAATRLALTEGIQAGINPVDAARRFRDAIGLTESQQAAVSNFRRLLGLAGSGQPGQAEALERALRDGRFDPTVRNAIANSRPLSADQINRMVQRYSERYVKYRSEVIGRTEALRSVHEGVEELYNQAFDKGTVTRESLTRTWDSSKDNRVRASHRHLDGMKRHFGETFPGLAGPLRYPGDPAAPASETVQCRCVLTTRVNPFKG